MTTVKFDDFKSAELKKRFPHSIFLARVYDPAIMGFSGDSIIYHELDLINLEMIIQSDRGNLPPDDSDEWQELFDDCDQRISNTFIEFEGKNGNPILFQQF